MKDLKHSQIIAMMRILKDIIYADGIVDRREVAMYEQQAESLGIDELGEKEIDELNSLFALSEINDMADENKEEFAKIMGRMIVVDEDINYNEVRLYNLIIDFCHINKTEEGDGHFNYEDVEDFPA